MTTDSALDLSYKFLFLEDDECTLLPLLGFRKEQANKMVLNKSRINSSGKTGAVSAQGVMLMQ